LLEVGVDQEPLRIIHLTDTHIVAQPGTEVVGTDSFTALERVLAAIQGDLWTPHLLIVTGDLSDDGSAASYQRLRNALTPLRIPTYCVPGNHDVLSEMTAHLHGGLIHVTGHVVWDPWQIVLLNSQVPGHGHGHLQPAELAALEAALQMRPQHHTLVGLHHGPFPVCPMPSCGLENAEELLTLVRRQASVRAVIAGHTHCVVDEYRNGVRLLVTPSTCLYVEHPQGLSVPDTQFWELHRFDPQRTAFRRLELHADGTIMTEVIWEASARAA
jgi:3',5'-cyclic-AMP phosphodiesterase